MPFSGKRLRALRLARGLTQAELAHRAHVRERQIIRWENDQNVPRLGSVKALARVLKTSVDALFDDEEADEDADADADRAMSLDDFLRRRIDVLLRERLQALQP